MRKLAQLWQQIQFKNISFAVPRFGGVAAHQVDETNNKFRDNMFFLTLLKSIHWLWYISMQHIHNMPQISGTTPYEKSGVFNGFVRLVVKLHQLVL